MNGGTPLLKLDMALQDVERRRNVSADELLRQLAEKAAGYSPPEMAGAMVERINVTRSKIGLSPIHPPIKAAA